MSLCVNVFLNHPDYTNVNGDDLALFQFAGGSLADKIMKILGVTVKLNEDNKLEGHPGSVEIFCQHSGLRTD